MTTDVSELLKAANYAWRTEENTERATAIAQQIIDNHPDSSEAAYAKKLLIEIGIWEEPTPPAIQRDKVREIVGKVTITDIDISFGNMILLLVKFAFAVIPAAIIVAAITFILYASFGKLFLGL